MAISKIVYKSSPSATPVTWMDVTQKTVTSSTMLNGTTALKNDGTDITGNIASKTSSNLSASGATVTAEAGYYASSASKTVASGTEGTPTATKGTVSNHSVTVTPSVTNTAGYISGGTKTGTGVTVSVSELESGTKSISANGTGIDVSGYSAVDVAVPTGGGGVNCAIQINDYVVADSKFSMKEAIPNLLADGGCVHLIYTLQYNSSETKDLQILSFGSGNMNLWSPGGSYPCVIILVSHLTSGVNANFRGVGNTYMNFESYADANDKVDLKFYSDHFEDVNTNTSYNYNSGAQSCMTALAAKSYLTVSINQSDPFTGAVVSYFAVEEN